MCEPVFWTSVAIGAATGAAGSAITGGDVLQGALMGGIMGGVTMGMGGFAAAAPGVEAGFMTSAGTTIFGETALMAGTMTYGAAGAAALGGLATSVGMGMLTPQTPDYSQYGYGAQPYEAQGYSSQHAKVTGSGGRQAAAVLASEIKQAKSLRKRQAEVADYGLGMDVAGTGLQIA